MVYYGTSTPPEPEEKPLKPHWGSIGVFIEVFIREQLMFL
jgi:hypothetical protein